MTKKWRNKPQRTLWANAIYKREFPHLAMQMANDGLTFSLVNNANGYEWRVADYQVPTKSVREVWGMTPHQMRRFIGWLLENESALTGVASWA